MRFATRQLSPACMFLTLAITACAEPPAPAAEASASPLTGAWSVTSMEGADGSVIDPAQPGLILFTDGYYSAVYTNRAEPRPLSATPFTPTDAEALEQFGSIIVNTGTYTVDGSTITFRPLVARAPEFIGGEAMAGFEVAGDVLTLRYQSILSAAGASPPTASSSITLRRVE